MEGREQEETVGERILAGAPLHCSSITHSAMAVFGGKESYCSTEAVFQGLLTEIQTHTGELSSPN